MKEQLLKTKLYIPPPKPKDIHRPLLIKRLNEGLDLKLSLISAPAGFGKTTLVSSWADERVLPRLRSPQPPSLDSIVVDIANEFCSLKDHIVLVLDDYHIIDAKPVDRVLSYLVSNFPPQLHLVISTREDPNLPLAGLRAQRQLNELRAEDLRLTLKEAAEFLKEAM